MSKLNRNQRRGQGPAIPVIYTAATREEALKHAPPDVLARCREQPCARCRAPLAAVACAMDQMADLARRAGRRLELLCGPCADRRLEEEQPEFVIGMLQHDPDIMARLRRHDAEKN